MMRSPPKSNLTTIESCATTRASTNEVAFLKKNNALIIAISDADIGSGATGHFSTA